MKTRTLRAALLGIAFSATAAAVITSATVRGETREGPLDSICRAADWPRIPAACLEGGRGYDVRIVDADAEATARAASLDPENFDLRFTAAFAG